MTPLYIFDLDGTLALIDHRRHLVEPPSRQCSDCGGQNHNNCVQCADLDAGWKADWAGFFAACVDDAPNWPVISLANTLIQSGADVHIWSGRSAEVMNETLTWLQGYFPGAEDDDLKLCMRREGDFTPDEKLKESWLLGLNEYDRKRLVCVFDDRAKVVAMWRRNGVTCCQVAPGEF